MSIQQLQDEVGEIKYELLNGGFKPISFKMNNRGVRILNNINALITKAYEEGKIEAINKLDGLMKKYVLERTTRMSDGRLYYDSMSRYLIDQLNQK